MCGRFVLFTTAEALIDAAGEHFAEVRAPQGTPGPRYNLAPTQVIPILRGGEVGTLEPARWGLLPHWKKDETGPPLFNARSETVASKPSFRDAYRSNRCLIPMNGYYEWHEKKPQFVSLGGDDTEIMWAAGLWATGLDRLSATMLTTDSAEPIAWLHNRMPRFLAPMEIQPWLAGEDMAGSLTPPELLERFVIRPVSPAVGNVRNDHAELINAVDQ
ncbi:SOS response-associated peptidase [Corynebacterium sp. A21]|uniref:SOS response-associated peptidase n=1 Tax=Corynebacterium sp. A21 TaxID=3457318 RepID=UPI003FD57DC2